MGHQGFRRDWVRAGSDSEGGVACSVDYPRGDMLASDRHPTSDGLRAATFARDRAAVSLHNRPCHEF